MRKGRERQRNRPRENNLSTPLIMFTVELAVSTQVKTNQRLKFVGIRARVNCSLSFVISSENTRGLKAVIDLQTFPLSIFPIKIRKNSNRKAEQSKYFVTGRTVFIRQANKQTHTLDRWWCRLMSVYFWLASFLFFSRDRERQALQMFLVDSKLGKARICLRDCRFS